MHNLIKSRALFEILKTPLPELLFDDVDVKVDADSAAKLTIAKLNVNASEFVPSFKRMASKEVGNELNLSALKRHFEALDKQKTAPAIEPYLADVNDVENELLAQHKTPQPQLKLPWKGFPKPLRSDRSGKFRKRQPKPLLMCPKLSSLTPAASRSAQVVLLNDDDYIICPKMKRAKKDKAVPNNSNKPKEVHKKDQPAAEAAANLFFSLERKQDAEERRREHERKVALEALKLVEQRRMRGPLVMAKSEKVAVNPIPTIHLSRSPVRFSPEERERVDKLRVAKRERIERVLREMHDELERQKRSLKLPPTPPAVVSKKAQKAAKLKEQKWPALGQSKGSKAAAAKVEKQKPAVIIEEEAKADNKVDNKVNNKVHNKVDKKADKKVELELPEPPKLEEIAAPKRYICLQRKIEQEEVVKVTPPKQHRYIPTTKEWDEQCKVKKLVAEAKALTDAINNEADNKENIVMELCQQRSTKLEGKQPESPLRQKLVLSSLDNIMPQTNLEANLEASLEARRQRSPVQSYVPRYVAPETGLIVHSDPSQLLASETRRGNLTHSFSIARAFANWPPPELQLQQSWPLTSGAASLPRPAKTIRRYSMAQLLHLEPLLAKLPKPPIAEALLKFGFMCD